VYLNPSSQAVAPHSDLQDHPLLLPTLIPLHTYPKLVNLNLADYSHLPLPSPV